MGPLFVEDRTKAHRVLTSLAHFVTPPHACPRALSACGLKTVWRWCLLMLTVAGHFSRHPICFSTSAS